MHVVSGVPTRNGNNHVKEIIDMAIDFQRAVKTLRLLHLPDDKIQVRVGVHSGSCVAGIVGVTNPRYIVLGDTVNTSAKMEAAGRPGRIHITKATRDLLVQFHPNRFHIVDRGETLIKSIGPMTTYWVPLPEEISTFEP
jgi:class 3 adenylate cyclase